MVSSCTNWALIFKRRANLIKIWFMSDSEQTRFDIELGKTAVLSSRDSLLKSHSIIVEIWKKVLHLIWFTLFVIICWIFMSTHIILDWFRCFYKKFLHIHGFSFVYRHLRFRSCLSISFLVCHSFFISFSDGIVWENSLMATLLEYTKHLSHYTTYYKSTKWKCSIFQIKTIAVTMDCLSFSFLQLIWCSLLRVISTVCCAYLIQEIPLMT